MSFLLDVINARPRREAIIRTRGDVDHVLQAIRQFVDEPEPEGMKRMLSNGYFLRGGAVGVREFTVDYRFKSAKISRAAL